MPDRIIIFDTTLRDGEQSPGATMNLDEKLRMARQLDLLGVDVIEAGFPASSSGDFEAVAAIAGVVERASIAGLARAVPGDIDRCWQAIENARHPRIHTFLATSPLHMEYKLCKSPEQVLEQITEAVSRAASYTKDVQFSPEDASRSDLDFLVLAVNTAIRAGATTINLPDTVGYSQPEEYAAMFRYVIARAENTRDGSPAVFSAHCHNDLGSAVANTLAAIRAGVRQAEVTIGGIGERAGNAALEEVAMALAVRKDHYGCVCNIDTRRIYPSARMLSSIIGQPIALNKPIVGANAFAHESGIHQDGTLKHRGTYEIMDPADIGIPGNTLVMGKHSGRRALKSKLETLGYILTESEVSIVFEAMKKLADLKKNVYDEDIEALVLEEVYRIPDKYRLLHLSVHTADSGLPPTAMVEMEIEGETRRHAGFGVGPVDAVFSAIATLVGRSPRLERFRVNAITGGTDALGEVTVRISENGHMAVGRGSHPDILNAGARAYINALNRLSKKREEK